jgi:Recombination endonuclease VII
MEDYRRMLSKQNGACAICKQVFQETLAVDHCHTTGKVRGLLCRKCNTGLGNYGDDPGRLREAAAYLEASRGVLPEA